MTYLIRILSGLNIEYSSVIQHRPIMRIWDRLATWLLTHPKYTLTATLVISVFFIYWTMQIKTDHAPGRFISEDSQTWIDFDKVSQLFGADDVALSIVFYEVDLTDRLFLDKLGRLTTSISEKEGITSVLSLANVPFPVRDSSVFRKGMLLPDSLTSDEIYSRLAGQPFLHGRIVSEDLSATVMIVRIDPEVNVSEARIGLMAEILAEVRAVHSKVAFAGVPQVRTEYANRITAETPLFSVLSLLISLGLIFLAFRSWRATLLSAAVVVLGLFWTLGLIAYFGHKLNVVTAVLPPLIIVIGMATAIHICTKLYDQFNLLNDMRAAVRVTVKTVGLATFLTCLTTAIGFGVLTISGSSLLQDFGIFASAGIMFLYVLTIIVIPTVFVLTKPPSQKTTKRLNHDHFSRFFAKLADVQLAHSGKIIAGVLLLLGLGLYGASKINSDIYVFSDFEENDQMKKDIRTFESLFGGVLNMDIMIESKRPGQFRSLRNLKQLDKLEGDLKELSDVGYTLSTADLMKFINQAWFNGNPRAYRMPSAFEMNFIRAALEETVEGDGNIMSDIPQLSDSTFSIVRLQIGIPDLGTSATNALADSIRALAEERFSTERFDISITGSAYVMTRSGENLVKNLFISLSVALLLISILMAMLFRSVKLTLISLIPNVAPLILLAGAMGGLGILLKPSTALIFSLAFGIAVDDTIHFLIKYRFCIQDGLSVDDAIRLSLRETGKAILFTSLVLIGGFLVFTLSSFGATINLGLLTAMTMTAALIANLFLLPALLHQFAPRK